MSRACLALVFCVTGATAGGCLAPIYSHGRAAEASAVSYYAAWKITGDLKDLHKAHDNSVSTAAVSPQTYANAAFTIDLGRSCLFNMVVIDHGANEYGYARRTAVMVSSDGKVFTPQYAAPGTRRVTVLSWLTPVMARYIRIQALTPGDRTWSVAEVYVM